MILTYPGHAMSDKGIETGIKKMEVIKNLLIPKTVMEVKSFPWIHKEITIDIYSTVCTGSLAFVSFDVWRQFF